MGIGVHRSGFIFNADMRARMSERMRTFILFLFGCPVKRIEAHTYFPCLPLRAWTCIDTLNLYHIGPVMWGVGTSCVPSL